MIPARFAPVLYGVMLSGIMSCIVTFVASVRTVGLGAQVFEAWLGAWTFAWPVACTVVLIVGPRVRRFVNKLVREAEPSS